MDRPFAKKVVRALKRAAREKVVDLAAFAAGRNHAEGLQRAVATREALAQLHPAHAVYVYAQNQLSVWIEQLTALDETARFMKIISQAEKEYLPNQGPFPPPALLGFIGTMSPSDACLARPPKGNVAKSPWPLDRPPVFQVTACVRAAPTTPASRSTFIRRWIRSTSAAFV